MRPTDNTAEMLGQLSEASYQMAVGFKLATERDQSERREAMLEVLMTLREMRHAVMVVAAAEGQVWVFHPDGDDVTICENCGKTLASHVGEDRKCP